MNPCCLNASTPYCPQCGGSTDALEGLVDLCVDLSRHNENAAHAYAAAGKVMQAKLAQWQSDLWRRRFELLTELRQQQTRPASSFAIDIRLRQHGLSSRVARMLFRRGIETVGHLTDKTADELGAICGIGPVGLKEIREWLGQFGLALKGERGTNKEERHGSAGTTATTGRRSSDTREASSADGH